jgi:hypothetical protein
MALFSERWRCEVNQPGEWTNALAVSGASLEMKISHISKKEI